MKKLLLSALMLTLALPAFAFDIPMPDGVKLNMYGQVRFAAYYDYRSTKPNVGDTKTDKSDLLYNLQGNSRLGWNFSAGKFKANMELNFNQDGVNPNGFGFRQFWGAYTFDNGLTLTAGQKTSIAGNHGSYNDIYLTDNGLAGFGNISDVRRPLIMLSYAGFDFAMISNERDHAAGKVTNTTNGVDTNGNLVAANVKEHYIPRFEAAYNLKFNNFSGKVFASYGLYNYSAGINKTQWVGIQSWHVGTYLNPTFGKMYVKFSLYYGMNVGMFGGTNGHSFNPTLVQNGDSVDTKNTSSFGVAAAFGINEIVTNLSAELAGGYALYMTDVDNVEDRNAYAVYLQAPYKFNQYVSLIPQIGYYGLTQDKADDKSYFMAGAQLRVFF